MQVYLHYLPHFKTVPEPAASTADELLLRSCVPAACLLVAWHSGFPAGSVSDRSPGVALLAPSACPARLPALPACLRAALSSEHCCRPAARAAPLCASPPPCRRDALSPEALAIVSYDTRQQERRTGPVRGVRANLQQAISDVRWAGRAGRAGWLGGREGEWWGGGVVACPPLHRHRCQPALMMLPAAIGTVLSLLLFGMTHEAQPLNGTARRYCLTVLQVLLC